MISVLLAVVLSGGAGAQEDPVLYLPFDNTCEPALAVAGVKVASAGEIAFQHGILGEGAFVKADCRYEVGVEFPVAGGTFAAWIRPSWPGTDPVGRTLMCIYGPPDQPDPWMRNRWSIVAGGGSIRFFIFPREGGRSAEISASIADWQPGEWHHFAATWSAIGEGAAGEMRLYLDGEQAAAATGLAMSAGRPGPLLDIGRDSDASPDYAEAVYDDVFLYARPLTAEEIGTAVRRVRAGDLPQPAQARTQRREAEGWACPHLPYRTMIEAKPPERAREKACYEVKLGLSADLAQLGVPGTPDPESLRLVEVGRDGAAVPCSVEGDRLSFVAPPETPAGEARRFGLYFDVLVYEPVGPLLVARRQSQPGTGEPSGVLPSDYATVAYGDAWDFDEGDTEAIDRFGDKPEYVRHVRIEDGALVANVEQDPYLIWGSMWGPEDRGERKARIDVNEYNVLEMRVRQSVPAAQWALFGRVAGSDQLQSYRFRVMGTGWQTIRINLLDEARWGGVLSAFRIDPTEEVEAEIAIDWVRLLALLPAERNPVELLGNPTGTAAAVVLSLPKREAAAGEEQLLTVMVRDAGGRPVGGQPVRVEFAKGSGGRLAAKGQSVLALPRGGLRGLTDGEGKLTVAYTADTRAREKADTLLASAEFPPVAAEPVTVDTKPGPAHHYRVLADGVTILREEDAPFEVTAEPVDQFGNPTDGPPPTKWEAADGRLETAPGPKQAAVRLTPDMAKRWVYTVKASSETLAGESGPICILPKGPRPNPVSVGPNGYFRTADGQPYVPLGGFYINWIGLPDPQTGEQGRIIRSFTDVDEKTITDWLRYLQSQGVTTLRFMLRTHTEAGLEPMDVGGRVNRPLFAKALRLMDLARPFGIRFLLVVHDDYNKPVYCNAGNLERFSLPQFAGEDLDALPPHQRRFVRDRKLLRLASEKYTDPDAMRCQDDYARELIGYLRGNPQVFGYELENEMVDCPREWATHAIEVIRGVDSEAPICVSHGGGGLHTADPYWWTHETPIDFYTYHLYPVGSTDATTDYGAAVLALAKYGTMAGTCFLGESSGDEFSEYPAERADDRRYIMRDIIWMSLIAGNPGCFYWNARGYEIEQFRLANQIVRAIDWTRWQRAKAETALVVDHPYNDDKYYRSPQGIADRAMMGRYCQAFLTQGLNFDFAMRADGYAKTATLAEFAPPEGAARPFRVSEGFQLASLTRADRAEGLLYVRNLAGIREWSVPKGGSMWLRERQAASLTVSLSPGPGAGVVRWWDLDTGASDDRRFQGACTLDLGVTEHDFVVLWQSQ